MSLNKTELMMLHQLSRRLVGAYPNAASAQVFEELVRLHTRIRELSEALDVYIGQIHVQEGREDWAALDRAAKCMKDPFPILPPREPAPAATSPEENKLHNDGDLWL